MKVTFPATTPAERVLLLFFAICVAGKRAAGVEEKVNKLFENREEDPLSLLDFWEQSGTLRTHLESVKLGKYTVICKAVRGIIDEIGHLRLNLETCTVEDLLRIPGVGPKSAQFFLMYSRQDYRGAVLDVHVLRWLSRRHPNIPRNTPTNGRYKQIETLFLKEADRWFCQPSELDEMIWKAGRDRKTIMYWGEIFGRPDPEPDKDNARNWEEYQAVRACCLDMLNNNCFEDDDPANEQLIEHDHALMLEETLAALVKESTAALGRVRTLLGHERK